MRPRGAVPALLLAVALGAALYVALALMIPARGGPLGVDRAAAEAAVDLRAGGVVSAVKVLTGLGAYPVLDVAVLLLTGTLLVRRRRREAVVLAAGTIATVLLTQALKAAEGRPRPPLPLVRTHGLSFPSGHSSAAVAWSAGAVALALAAPGARRRAGLLAAGVAVTVGVGLSRIYLSAHWLSDVLAGWSVGVGVFAACALVARYAGRTRHNGAESA